MAAQTIQFFIGSTERLTDDNGTYDVYVILIQGARNFTKVVKKRFSEFPEFEKLWRPLYPDLQIELPPDHFFYKSDEVLEERKIGLAKYINQVAQIKALHVYLAQFLEFDASLMSESKLAMNQTSNQIASKPSQVQAVPPVQCKVAIAQFDYQGQSSSELNVSAGERLILTGDDANDGWLLVKSEKTGKRKTLPDAYV